MDVSPNEAKEALAAIQSVTQKTRHSLATSGIYIFLFTTGMIWLVGFLATQFLPLSIVPYIWLAASGLGSVFAIYLGRRLSRNVRSPSGVIYGRRIGIFWLLLALFAGAVLAVAQPADSKQITMLIILFVMFGQLAMGLLFSFASTWWVIPVTLLALAGYFLLPDYFYLWMGLLGGGSMVAISIYIRSRW